MITRELSYSTKLKSDGPLGKKDEKITRLVDVSFPESVEEWQEHLGEKEILRYLEKFHEGEILRPLRDKILEENGDKEKSKVGRLQDEMLANMKQFAAMLGKEEEIAGLSDIGEIKKVLGIK